jgi:predicted transcriptional regulator
MREAIMATTTPRELVNRLIDDLPDALLDEAARRLTDLRDDQFLRAFLEAPEDDEPLTDEDIAAIEEGKAEIARGEVSDWEDVKRRCSDGR